MKLSLPTGQKIFGVNLVPQKSQVIGALAWEHFFSDWNWTNWIKPQLDCLLGNGVGANCIRVIGASPGVLAGYITQDVYNARWRQLADYVASAGAYLYPCACGNGANSPATPDADVMADCFASTLLMLQSNYKNIIGVDLVQESNSGATTQRDARYALLIQLLKIRGVTLPMTCSTSETVSSTAGAPWINATVANYDFIDCHVYTHTAALDQLIYMLGTHTDKDIILGEFGRDMSINIDSQTADLKRCFDIGNQGDPRVRGGLLWAATDQDDVAANMWGAYDSAFVPRQNKLSIFRRYTRGSVLQANDCPRTF